MLLDVCTTYFQVKKFTQVIFLGMLVILFIGKTVDVKYFFQTPADTDFEMKTWLNAIFCKVTMFNQNLSSK